MPRYLRICIGLLLTAALASCGKDSPLPTGPTEPQPAPSQVELLTAPGCSPTEITALVREILPGPLGVLVAAKLAALNLDRTGGRIDRARARMFEIVDALVKARNNGLYANDPVKRHKLEALIKLLFCLVGLPTPPIDLGPDGGAAVVTPTSPTTVVQTQSQKAGTEIKTGDVPQTVLVTVTRLNTNGPWLDTPLDQYGPAYQFSVVPNVQFTEAGGGVLTGICINPTDDPMVDARLRLAHDNATGPLAAGNVRFGNIEIINQAADLDLNRLNLNCTSGLTVVPEGFLQKAASYFLPAPLFATVSPATTGGKVKTYSPFAAVDPGTLTYGSSNWLYVQPSTGNPTPPSAYTGLNAITPITPTGPWAFGDAPFGHVRDEFGSFATSCDGSINYATVTIATQWLRAVDTNPEAEEEVPITPGEYTYLFARKVFFAGQSGSLDLPIDNDIQVWLDGVDVTSTLQYGESPQFVDGFLIHDNCATKNQVTLPNIAAGVHVLAVKARDRGVASFFDAQFNPND